MLLINLIFEFCVVIVHADCTPRAWLPSDLTTSRLVCNLYFINIPLQLVWYAGLPDSFLNAKESLVPD